METVETEVLPFDQGGHFSLVPHVGTQFVSTFEEVKEVETPEANKNYTPLPHAKAFSLVKEALQDVSIEPLDEFHALARDGQRYMALMPVQPQDPSMWKGSDYVPVVGVRNSHDKQFAFELLVAAGVYGIENLFFSDSEPVGMKRHVNLDDSRIYDAISEAVFALPYDFRAQERRFKFYRRKNDLTRKDIHDLIFQVYEDGIIPATAMPRVKEAWVDPEDSFVSRYGNSVWKFMNAVLYARREKYVFFQPSRNAELAEILDPLSGYDPTLFDTE